MLANQFTFILSFVMKIQCVSGCSTNACLLGVLEYPEKSHCCSCIGAWILTDSGVHPRVHGADRWLCGLVEPLVYLTSTQI